MAWQTLVTNWNASSYFNYTDWNRIEGNCDVIVAFLVTCGYIVPITTISNRSDGSYLDFYDSLNRIENNIWAISWSVRQASIHSGRDVYRALRGYL